MGTRWLGKAAVLSTVVLAAGQNNGATFDARCAAATDQCSVGLHDLPRPTAISRPVPIAEIGRCAGSRQTPLLCVVVGVCSRFGSTTSVCNTLSFDAPTKQIVAENCQVWNPSFSDYERYTKSGAVERNTPPEEFPTSEDDDSVRRCVNACCLCGLSDQC